ncbi:type 1 glutamine amidotransferase domain-containing protein [Aquihabitans daechungensis]|uniref:type 1 glutamine amidotransferase domain-containing protein n=1 Tax=Aquihabitans daechungensis TaxID=1052257 RepID=UPI003BA3034F
MSTTTDARDLDLTGTTIAFLATDGVEQVELTHPWEAAKAAGATVHLVSTTDEVQGFHHLDKGDTFAVDRQVSEVNPAVYDALVLPGGVANPDDLRTDAAAVGFVRSFLEGDKLVAAICHAPWTLIEADVVSGRRMTSWPSLQTDLRNAGADWVDEEVVVDVDGGAGTLITSRNPDDLPAFSRRLLAELGERSTAST